MSDYEQLRRLLLGDEQDALAAQQQRLQVLETARANAARQLPQLLLDAQKNDPHRRLSGALEKPLASALGNIVRSERQTIVDALFPVIGPAIRRAIAEALRGLVADLNAGLESSFTPRGIGWRIEAWRSGVSYSQIVLKHTMRYKLDHLFLIESDSGLVIHRESAPDLPDLDSDAIAGMLTAIGEFVKDSVGSGEQGTLNAANVGEYVLWVLHGPRANLATFIRGVPPQSLRDVLQKKLEALHERFNDPMAQLQAGSADVGAALEAEFDLPSIAAAATRDEAAVASIPAASRKPVLVVGTLMVFLLVGLFARDWIWQRRVERVTALLGSWPGLHVDAIDSRTGRLVSVRGLIDPLADRPDEKLRAILGDGVKLDWQLRGYVAADPELVLRRARSILHAPESVRLDYRDGTLRASGSAGSDWVAQATRDAPSVPGVARFDAGGLHADWVAALVARVGRPEGVSIEQVDDRLRVAGIVSKGWIDALPAALDACAVPAAARDLSGLVASEAARLAELTQAIENAPVLFADDIQMTAEGAQRLAQLIEQARQAQQLALALGRQLEARTYGQTDDAGSVELNRELRQRRARALAEALNQTLPQLRVGSLPPLPDDDPRVTLKLRAARLVLTLTPDIQP